MSRRVFVDFHHSSLLRSLVMLFEERFGMEVFRPIGLDWWVEGYWAINDQPDTARQFLSLEQAYKPEDGTPPLNIVAKADPEQGIYACMDPGNQTAHMACTLQYFKTHKFDYVIATIPAHVPLFKKLIERFQPEAKLIIQMGNNWNIEDYEGENVLASIAPQAAPGVNAIFYHQEMDLKQFQTSTVQPSRKIYSFVNVIENTGQGWEDYKDMKQHLQAKGIEMRAFGGQCPDGNMNGPQELADKMREAMFIFHVKPGGDGFGHILHAAYAIGRPVITRSSHYRGQLGAQLLVPGTFIDLDAMSAPNARNLIWRMSNAPEMLAEMGQKAAQRFNEVVDYNKEAREIWQWLEKLN